MVALLDTVSTGKVEQPVDPCGQAPLPTGLSTDLVEPGPSDLRLLSPSAQSLARVLIRERTRQAPEDGWFIFDLGELARRAHVAYGTAKAALAELRHAGLLACERHVIQRKVLVETIDGHARFEPVNAYERNWYSISGAVRRRAGLHRLELDRAAWFTFVDAVRRSQKKLVRLVAKRPAWPLVEWQASWTAELMGHQDTPSLYDVLGLGTKSSTSVFSTSNKNKVETSKKALARIPSSDEEESITKLFDWMHSPDDLDSGSPISLLLASGSRYSDPRRDPTYTGPWSPPFRLPDRHVREPSPIIWLSPEMVPEQKATYVVDAYRRAVKQIYGIDWFHYFKGDIKKAKHFDKLLASGVAFAEHSIPPFHWALWRLTWFAKNVKAFAHKPPPVWMIMNAKKVSEKSGWFRKDYDLPVTVFKLDPMIYEQRMRNQEARNRWRNVPDPLMCMPRPYVEKRRREIANGLEEPHDNWPRRAYWKGVE